MLSVSGPRQKGGVLGYIQKAFPIRNRRTRTPSHCCCCRDTPLGPGFGQNKTALARNKKERRAVSKHNTQKRRRRLFLGNVTSFCLLHPICWPPMPHFLPAAGCLWRGRLADPSIVGLSLLRLLPSVRTGNRPPVTSTECTASGASYSREERTNKFWGRLKLLSYLSGELVEAASVRSTEPQHLTSVGEASNGVRLHAFTRLSRWLPLGSRGAGGLDNYVPLHRSIPAVFLAASKRLTHLQIFFYRSNHRSREQDQRTKWREVTRRFLLPRVR